MAKKSFLTALLVVMERRACGFRQHDVETGR